MTQLSFLEPIKPKPRLPKIDGESYDEQHDGVRLNGQLKRVLNVIQDGRWRTLQEIQSTIQTRFQEQDTEAGISARLRDFRKDEFGGHVIAKRRRGRPSKGLWEYRLINPPKEVRNVDHD